MNFPANVGVVTVGYKKMAFADANDALQLMALLSRAVTVEEDGYTHRDMSGKKYFLNEESMVPELKFVPTHQFNTQQTSKEAKEAWAREQRDREDLSGGVKEVPTLQVLEAPTVTTAEPDDGIPF